MGAPYIYIYDISRLRVKTSKSTIINWNKEFLQQILHTSLYFIMQF